VFEAAVRIMKPVVRNALLGTILLGGLALAAGRRGGDPPEPTTDAPAAEEEPAAPAPEIFPGSLPLALEEVPEGLANLSAQSCNACHWQIHDDWSNSSHTGAWRSDAFQEAIHRVGDSTACTSCHLPLTNQHSRLATGYVEQDLTRPLFQDNPTWDPTLMAEGVMFATGSCSGCTRAPPHPIRWSSRRS